MSQQQTVLRVQTNAEGNLIPIYEFLDLYSDIPIKLNKSFAELQDIAKKNTDYTIGLTIPGSKKNNKFFENFFNVDSSSLYFDATKRNLCDVLLGDEPLFRGYLKLNKVSVMNSKIEYDVTLYSTIANLFGAMGNRLMNELNFEDLDYHFNHTFDLATVTNTFNQTNFQIDGEKPLPYFYPIVHNGYEYSSGTTVNLSGTTTTQTRFYTPTQSSAGVLNGYATLNDVWAAGNNQFTINSPTQGLRNNQLKPALSVWNLFKLIFKTYGYTIKSDFFNTPWMKSLYMYGYFSSETTKFAYRIQTIENQPLEGVEIIPILSGSTVSVYVTKAGTGIPCYCLSDISYTISLEEPYEGPDGYPIQVYIPAVIKAGTSQTDTNIYSRIYKKIFSENDAVLVSAGPLKYLPQAVGTTIPYIDGAPVNFAEVIDNTVKQIDFVSSIAKKFNLIFVSNPDNPIELIVEPYDFYVGTGNLYDWTEKLSYDKGWSVEPALNFVESQLTLTDMEDNDDGNKQYKDRFKLVYGTNIVFNKTDFKSQEKKIETIFSPEVIRTWSSQSGSTIGLPLGINYTATNTPVDGNNASVDWTYKGLKSKPKLFFWLGGFNPFLDIVGEKYPVGPYATYNVYVQNSNTSGYTKQDSIPAISHTMPIGLADEFKINNDSLSILFNSERKFEISPVVVTYNTYTENDAYNKFYNNRITNIYNPNTRFLTGYFNLKYSDVKNLNANDVIKIQEQYFVWNKINEFNLTNRELTKVELIQLNVNPQKYTDRYFAYSYCDNQSECFTFKTDFTNPNLLDTNYGWSVYYDHQVGMLTNQTSGFTSTFLDIQGGTPKYVPYSMYEITEDMYLTGSCVNWECDTLKDFIYTNNGAFTPQYMPTFWVNSGTTLEGVNVFRNCDEFYSAVTTNNILTGSSTNHGSSVCVTPTPTPTITPTATLTPTPTPTSAIEYYYLDRCYSDLFYYSIGYPVGTFNVNDRVYTNLGETSYIVVSGRTDNPGGALLTLTYSGLTGCQYTYVKTCDSDTIVGWVNGQYNTNVQFTISSTCYVAVSGTTNPTIGSLITGAQTPGTCCTTPTPTPTNTSTPTPTPTASPEATIYTLNFGYDASNGWTACSNWSAFDRQTLYSYTPASGITNGSVIYKTYSVPLTTVADNGWYSDGTNFYVATAGSLYSQTPCSTPQPTPTMTPTPSLTPVGYGVYTGATFGNPTLACADTNYPSITVYVGPGDTISDGDILYTDYGLSSPFVGNSQYYHIYKDAARWAAQISSGGYVSNLTSC